MGSGRVKTGHGLVGLRVKLVASQMGLTRFAMSSCGAIFNGFLELDVCLSMW